MSPNQGSADTPVRHQSPIAKRLESARYSRFAVVSALLLLASAFSAEAHAPDTSYLHAVVSQHSLELRFTFDLATLHRIDRLDADLDGKVSRTEAEAAAPDIAAFLQRTITLEVNNTKADLGPLQSLGWPLDAADTIEEKDYGQTLLHLTFTIQSDKLIEDFYVLYEVFGQLGSVHRAVADIDQDGKHLEVVFTELEPDYLYDTYWRSESAVTQTPQSAVRSPREQFQDGVRVMWEVTAFPFVLLGVGLLFPRKTPLVLGAVVLGWFVWDWIWRMKGIDRMLGGAGGSDLWSAPAHAGMLFAVVSSSLMVVPLITLLQRYRNHVVVIVAAWLSLFLGASECYAWIRSCRLGLE